MFVTVIANLTAFTESGH